MPQLPQESWRYTVVEFPVDAEEVWQLLMCGNLLSPSLEFGLVCTPFKSGDNWAYAYGHSHAKVFSYFESFDRFGESVKIMPLSEIKLLQDCWDSILGKSNESFLIKALTAFDQMRLLPDNSDACVLTLFGIIESLVTHMPEPKDTLDSIRRQLRKKMKLLKRRFIRTVDASLYFDSKTLDTDDKLWNKLYDYRSTLAHGSMADFHKEFIALKNKTSVAKFIKETVKLLIIEGLKDEQFLADLRDC